MIYCMRNKCVDISTVPVQNVSTFQSQKIEANNSMFFIYSQIRASGEQSPVVCDAEDTDILITAAYVTTQITGVLGI